MKKRILPMLLSVAMTTSLLGGVAANAAVSGPLYEKQAQTLYQLGMFKGTGFDAAGEPQFSLDQPATRMQGLIILIRLLGEEKAALDFQGQCPFGDVPGYGKPYAAYAADKGYVKGVAPGVFGDGPLVGNAFLTFVLRALGYDDQAGDFVYNRAFLLAEDLGIIQPGECASPTAAMARDTCVKVAYNALLTPVKGTDELLLDKLARTGAIPQEVMERGYLHSDSEKAPLDDFSRMDMGAWSAAHTALMERRVADARGDAVALGLPADISWIAAPRNMEELVNNIYCCFLVGEYDLFDLELDDLKLAMDYGDRFRPQNMKGLIRSNPELMGAFCNVNLGGGFYRYEYPGGVLCNLDLKVDRPSLSNEEVYAQQQEALAAARAIHDKLHADGAVTEDMTQLEIAQVYYTHLQRMGVKNSGLAHDNPDRGQYMKYDTAYACLVNRKADCVGRAAAFNLLLHLEGISSRAVACHFKNVGEGQNHVMNLLVLDGKEYAADWGNYIDIQPISQLRSRCDFFTRSLEYARSRG